jgi:tRNA(adenine34) deaminase
LKTEHTTDMDRHWMDLAIAEARRSGPDIPVGSLLVNENILLAKAHNRKERTQDPTDHAEIIVIRQVTASLKSWRLTGTTLYTTLEPCPMCAEAIIQSRISRLVFGAYDPKSGAAGSLFNLFVPGRPYPMPEILGGIAEEECKSLIVSFFRGRNAK